MQTTRLTGGYDLFAKNSVYLRVRLRERFINPRVLKNPPVYKIKERLQ